MKPSKPSKLRFCANCLGWFVCFAFLIFMGAWYGIIKPSAVTYSNEPFVVATPVVRAGEILKFRVERLNTSAESLRIRVTRWLVEKKPGGEHTDLFATERNVASGKSSRDTEIVISAATPTGTYQVCGETRVLGTLIDKKVGWCTEEFRVLGKT